MKIILTSLVFTLFCFFSLNAQQNLPTSEKTPLMSFDTKHISLGEVTRGETREMEYAFANTGNEDIKISLVSSCECTTIKYPRKPIAPGETGVLKVVFDSTEKEASETVDIDVYLENVDPESGDPIWYILDYDFILIQ